MRTIAKVMLSAAAYAAIASSAISQETAQPVPPPKEQAPIEIPKTKGAYLIVAIQPNPLVAAMTSAKACEEERARVAAQNITSYCIWVR